jgi:uncharacterized membrane protein
MDNVVNIALWVIQIFLALGFLAVGFGHTVRFESSLSNPRMAWLKDVGRDNMRIIGALEIAGALGLILPALTGILPWLTPLAAVGLALLMLFAIIFHLRRGEPWVGNLLFLVLAVVVVVGRVFVKPF